MEFHEILAKCGNNGRYQYMLIGFLGYVGFVATLQFYAQNLISSVPDHWCYHEKLENKTFMEIAEIYENFERPSCTRLETIDDNGNITISSKACDHWIYKYDFGFRSINIEYNWVCDSAYKARVGQSLYFFGSVVGSFLFGSLGDTLGRLKSMILANYFCSLGDLITVFSGSLLTFSFGRFIGGLGTGANVYMTSILVIEYVSPRLRNIGLSTATGISFSLSQVIAPWLAVWIGQWRIFLICISLPVLLVGLSYSVLQESAQWLITRNDIDGAILRLKNVAKFNGQTVSDEDFEAFRKTCEENYQKSLEEEKPKLRDLFNWPHLRRTYCIMVVSNFFTLTAGTIVARSFDGLGISPFIVFSLFGISVLPSGIVQAPIQQAYGRKTTTITTQIGTGVFAIALGLIMAWDQNANIYLKTVLAMLARFFCAVSNQSIGLLVTELIPTSVRSRGFAASYVLMNMGAFSTPYIQHLELYFIALPRIVVAAFMFLGAYLCLYLPETRGKKLPISLAEGDQFGKGEKMFDFIKEIRNRKKKEKDLSMTTIQQTEALENLMPNSKS